MADLAKERGLALPTYRNRGLHKQEGHPPPISSAGSRTLLWDAEQVDEFRATGSFPPLPDEDSDDDLLDRYEAAQLRGVTPKTWTGYAEEPQMRAVAEVIGGVAHWPRGAVKAFTQALGGKAGRPAGSGDIVPRDEMLALVTELLDARPQISGQEVAEELGVHVVTAQKVLVDARGRRIADVLQVRQGLTPEEAARQLGYPSLVIRTAVRAAAVEQRMRAVQPYLESVRQALLDAGIPLRGEAPTFQVLKGDVCAASLVLGAEGPVDAAALVWDDRWGWRTATSRLHPIPKDHTTPPEGPGIRYLGKGLTPAPAEVIADLSDARRGTKRPPADHRG
ncbi:DUF6292 family protein [Streptomyces sp. NPDC004031]